MNDQSLVRNTWKSEFKFTIYLIKNPVEFLDAKTGGSTSNIRSGTTSNIRSGTTSNIRSVTTSNIRSGTTSNIRSESTSSSRTGGGTITRKPVYRYTPSIRTTATRFTSSYGYSSANRFSYNPALQYYRYGSYSGSRFGISIRSNENKHPIAQLDNRIFYVFESNIRDCLLACRSIVPRNTILL